MSAEVNSAIVNRWRGFGGRGRDVGPEVRDESWG